MYLADLTYELPPERIAQEPLPVRTAARLLVLDRAGGTISHRGIADLPRTLRAGDLLVFNDARVIPARVVGRRPSGGRIEILVCEPRDDVSWHVLAKGAPRVGERLELPGTAATWVADLGGGSWALRFDLARPLFDWLDEVGSVPLPPYVRRPEGPTPHDVERYQTVFARVPGAVAAPTAGLHFTPELMQELHASEVQCVFITLHVGPGTFLPIRDGNLVGYRMAPERFSIGPEAAAAILGARREGRRVVAVGTTTVRALESAAAGAGWEGGAASLFIAPGHRFAVIDAMVTNFHLPRTPLLAMVAAFAGWDRIRTAYEEAVRLEYRFYSFGDAMLIE
jgi:S-adenosylmethionine:tRNA ribosyltransferase-isomerase